MNDYPAYKLALAGPEASTLVKQIADLEADSLALTRHLSSTSAEARRHSKVIVTGTDGLGDPNTNRVALPGHTAEYDALVSRTAEIKTQQAAIGRKIKAAQRTLGALLSSDVTREKIAGYALEQHAALVAAWDALRIASLNRDAANAAIGGPYMDPTGEIRPPVRMLSGDHISSLAHPITEYIADAKTFSIGGVQHIAEGGEITGAQLRELRGDEIAPITRDSATN